MKRITFLLSLLIITFALKAQNWLTSGNALAATGTLGSTTNFSVLFKSNNSERGRLTNSGLWGFGTTAPNSKVHINSASGQDALRVQVNGSTKFFVNSSGRVGIGTTTPKSKLDVAGIITGFDSYFGKTYPISVGTSGASYSSVGYGLTFSDTTANYRYRLNDFSSMLSFRAGGFDFNTAPFGTAGNTIPYTTAMAVLQNGNVGIGTITPASRFSVTGSSSSGKPLAFIENTSDLTTSSGMYIKVGGGIGTYFIAFLRYDGSFLGHIDQVNANNVNYSTSSDKRLKNIIGFTQKGLTDLMKIKVYDYSFKSDPNKNVQTGFMAQELYEIFPQAVSKPRDNNEPAEKDPWMVDYGRVTPLIIKSVQEQQKIIDELKEKIASQEERLIKLETALQSLTANRGDVPNTVTNASLEQNNPNPFTKNTIIRYSIPQGSKGQINIYDQAGKLVKTLKANAGGQSQMSVYDLAAGAYTYTLMVDGKITLSKQMLIIR